MATSSSLDRMEQEDHDSKTHDSNIHVLLHELDVVMMRGDYVRGRQILIELGKKDTSSWTKEERRRHKEHAQILVPDTLGVLFALLGLLLLSVIVFRLYVVHG